MTAPDHERDLTTPPPPPPPAAEHQTPVPAGTLSPRAKIAVLGVVVIALVAALALRGTGTPATTPQPAVPGGAGLPAPGSGPDPVAAYEDALEAGLPIYVLFHSATCPSCVEITAASVDARPDYEGSVTFVDVVTDDPRSRPLFSRFNFQFIPTLFFLAPDGSVVDQHTGPLPAEELRARLDALAAGS